MVLVNYNNKLVVKNYLSSATEYRKPLEGEWEIMLLEVVLMLILSPHHTYLVVSGNARKHRRRSRVSSRPAES